MSAWTHVAGIIWLELLDNRVEWPKSGLEPPRGSEGCLHHRTIQHIDPEDAFQTCTIVIWGDLRDYDNDEEILQYFERIIGKYEVRQSCFTITNPNIISTWTYELRAKKQWVCTTWSVAGQKFKTKSFEYGREKP